MNKILRLLTAISATMLAAGVTLPFAFQFLFGGFNWPPALWNFLQVGGLAGLTLFGIAYRLTKPRIANVKPAGDA